MVDVGRKRDEIVEKVSLRKMSETVRGVFGNMWKEREWEREEKKRKREGKEKKRKERKVWEESKSHGLVVAVVVVVVVIVSLGSKFLCLFLSLSHDFLLLLHLHLRYQLSQPTTTTTIFLIPLPCRAGHGWRQGILRRFHTKIHFLILNKRLICSSGKKKCGIFSFVFSATKRRVRVFFLLYFRLISIAELGGRFWRERDHFCFFFGFLIWFDLRSELGFSMFESSFFCFLYLRRLRSFSRINNLFRFFTIFSNFGAWLSCYQDQICVSELDFALDYCN